MSNKLKITIEGMAGSGKTHMLHQIMHLLEREGYDVTAFDDGGQNVPLLGVPGSRRNEGRIVDVHTREASDESFLGREV